MNMLTLTAILLFLAGGASTQQLLPPNAMLLKSSDARFNCSVNNPGWTIMTFYLNKVLAASVSEDGSMNSFSDRYSITNYSSTGVFRYEFVIKNTTRNDTEVACQVPGALPKTATLSVQETGTLEIVGSNRSATQGDQITFQCLAAGWFPAAQLSWAVNGAGVDASLYSNTSMQNGTSFTSSSTLNLTASNNVSVECLAVIPALTTPQRRSVFLTVFKPKARDYTVLLAIVLAFGLAGLLAFLIILIVICCKKRKRQKSRYEEEARANAQREQARRERARREQGHDNLGYTTDRSRDDGIFAISGFKLPNYSSNNQRTDMVDYNRRRYESRYPGSELDDYEQRKHRHATIV